MILFVISFQFFYHVYLYRIKMLNYTDFALDSFYMTYVFLMTTGTITFIEAMRTNDKRIRNIMNLETCISIIAAFFYGKFITSIEKKGVIDYKEMNSTRYADWAITTPIMLLVLVLVFLYNTNGGALPISSYLVILLLNYGMLGFGYLGETGVMNKLFANITGFVFFAGLYGYIYNTFLSKKYNFENMLLYFTFLILWTLYGVVYFMEDISKNFGYNILDLFSKCFVGIFFWAYFTNVFKL